MTKSRATWLFALGAVAAVALTHAQVLGLEFRADDYAILRPWTGAEVREALVGSWSGTRAFQDPYHRPIAGLYHAAISTIFGLHAPAMHLVSLVELAAVVFLLTGIVRRETTRLGVAALSAAVYLTNPLLRDSTSSWIFNQYQLVALLLTGAAVLIWQRRRTAARPAAWWPIFALAAVGWYVKEDTIMLLPALLAAQTLRAKRLGDGPAPSRALWIASAAMLVALVAVRIALLPPFAALAERNPLQAQEVATSLAYAIGRPFFARVHAHLAPVGTALLLTLLGAAVASFRTRHDGALRLTILGGALLVGAALPLMFQPGLGTTRVHLVLFASAIVGAGGIAQLGAWLSHARAFWLRAAAAVAVIAGLWSLHGAALGVQHDLYAPCSPVQLEADAQVIAWPVVPEPTRRWLIEKAEACRLHGRVAPIRTAITR